MAWLWLLMTEQSTAFGTLVDKVGLVGMISSFCRSREELVDCVRGFKLQSLFTKCDDDDFAAAGSDA